MSPTAVSTSAATSLLARYKAVRQASQQLCRPLSPEDMMVQSCPEASPVKWHLAHTSWFFETFVLTPYARAYRPFHPDAPSPGRSPRTKDSESSLRGPFVVRRGRGIGVEVR